MTRTVVRTEPYLLPWSGYMAVNGDGTARPGYEKPYRHIPLKLPDLAFDDLIDCGATKRTFGSLLVETAARVRDAPGTRLLGAFDAVSWLESKGLIVPIRAHLSTLPCLEIIYEITPQGLDFLKINEAPESWL